jgi:steroid 5-alpha reductase family enzyme
MTVEILGLILLFVYLFSMVVFAQMKGDTSIANFTWGGGVMLVALYTFFRMSSFLTQQILITSMITFWALRLIVFV